MIGYVFLGATVLLYAGYDKFIKPSELAGFTRQAGLELLEIKGMTYNPLTQIYRLGSDTDVNYMIATRKSE
jgi:2-polyprenyl-6-hydroxyphenyl methylase/3-demethylubiquinone-9 3-methyltransferase